jgi:hypothetical protein
MATRKLVELRLGKIVSIAATAPNFSAILFHLYSRKYLSVTHLFIMNKRASTRALLGEEHDVAI